MLIGEFDSESITVNVLPTDLIISIHDVCGISDDGNLRSIAYFYSYNIYII